LTVGVQTMVALVAVVVLAAVLRSFRLTARSLWFDEAWSVSLTRMPLGRSSREVYGACPRGIS
jgi:predicted membrane-bound mannosyltransferase